MSTEETPNKSKMPEPTKEKSKFLINRLLPDNLSPKMQRYAGMALLLTMALLVVLVMRNFSSGVAGNRQIQDNCKPVPCMAHENQSQPGYRFIPKEEG